MAWEPTSYPERSKMKQQHIQIGMDTYRVDTVEHIMDAIRSIVIYHQGELSTMKPWTKNTLSDAQQGYISYNMMEAMQTTSDDDYNEISRLEFHYEQQATYLGHQGCIDWMVSELGE